MRLREFLTLSATALAGAALPACSRSEHDGATKAATGPTEAERLATLERQRREQSLLQNLEKDRFAVITDIVQSPDVDKRLARALSSPNLPLRLEQVAVVFSDTQRDRTAIDLLEVEKRFGSETRLIVAGLLQHGLKRAFIGLANDFALKVKELNPTCKFSLKELHITVVPDSVAIDGDWGAKSSHLREGVQELMYRYSYFEYGRLTQRPRQTFPSETLVGPTTLAAIRWFTPEHAAFMVPLHTSGTPGETYEKLKASGKQDAGFAAPRTKGMSFIGRLTPPSRTTPEFAREKH
jgi:hypothetical protein